jgi:hypothetical protein
VGIKSWSSLSSSTSIITEYCTSLIYFFSFPPTQLPFLIFF